MTSSYLLLFIAVQVSSLFHLADAANAKTTTTEGASSFAGPSNFGLGSTVNAETFFFEERPSSRGPLPADFPLPYPSEGLPERGPFPVQQEHWGPPGFQRQSPQGAPMAGRLFMPYPPGRPPVTGSPSVQQERSGPPSAQSPFEAAAAQGSPGQQGAPVVVLYMGQGKAVQEGSPIPEKQKATTYTEGGSRGFKGLFFGLALLLFLALRRRGDENQSGPTGGEQAALAVVALCIARFLVSSWERKRAPGAVSEETSVFERLALGFLRFLQVACRLLFFMLILGFAAVPALLFLGFTAVFAASMTFFIFALPAFAMCLGAYILFLFSQ